MKSQGSDGHNEDNWAWDDVTDAPAGRRPLQRYVLVGGSTKAFPFSESDESTKAVGEAARGHELLY